MLFMFHCVDKAGAADVRAANRADHLAYLEANADRIFAAGPLLSDDQSGMVGSLLIVECADAAAAEAFAANDPYAKAGLFDGVTIRPWRRVYPKA
ncbi:YciI family protein [Azospirillum humicireducens]|uniref:YciI family protein n=1 Tax=Azospirillum humicireducens TaxID=1226968 RepID=A0A160JGT3_9PROT|nr:YciI family protein [Azospirillum humicireducens]ANC92212.1 YciI family protein [Azospirillum humicireducens]